MKLKTLFLILFVILFVSFAPAVSAKTVTIQGRVDTSSTAIIGGSITFTDELQKTNFTVPVSPSGIYILSLPEGVYDVTLIPPTGSNLPQITKYHQQIGVNGTYNFNVSSPKTPSSFFQQKTILFAIAILILILLVGGISGYIVLKKKKR